MTKNLKDRFHDKQLADLHEMKSYPYISEGKALFFAGPKANWKQAETFAQNNKMVSIARTKGGKTLEALQDKEILNYVARKGNQSKEINSDSVKAGVNRIWGSSSRRYAAAAKGDVKTFVCGANTRSIYRRIELPTLLNNRNVQTINGLDRTALHKFTRNIYITARQNGMTGREAAAHARTAVHHKIALAEIRQDLNQAKTKNAGKVDPTLHADALKRLAFLKEQHKQELRAKIETRNQNKAHSQAQEKSQSPSAGRIRAIQDRAHNRYVEKGMKSDQAEKASAITSAHIARRLELSHERRNAFEKADKATIRSYVEKQQALRQDTIAARQEQARSQGQKYTGPAQMPEKFKELDLEIKVREYYTRAQLEKNRREGHVNEREYESLRARNESILSHSRQRDLSAYFEGQPSGRSFSQSQSTPPASQDTNKHIAEAASYGYNYTPATQNHGTDQSRTHTHDGHSHSHHGS